MDSPVASLTVSWVCSYSHVSFSDWSQVQSAKCDQNPKKNSIHPMSLVCFRAFISWYLPASILLPVRRARVRCEWRNGIVPSQCNLFLQYPPATTTRWRMSIHLKKRWVTNLERQNSWLNQTTKSSLFCVWLHCCLQIYVYIYIPNYIYTVYNRNIECI